MPDPHTNKSLDQSSFQEDLDNSIDEEDSKVEVVKENKSKNDKEPEPEL